MYFVFAWDQYYPRGGFNDCRLRTPSLDAAIDKFNSIKDDEELGGKQIVDSFGSVLYEGWKTPTIDRPLEDSK